MRTETAIIVSVADVEGALASVRAEFSKYREILAQEEKTSSKLETLRDSKRSKEIAIGRELAAMRDGWPRTKPPASWKHGTWQEMLDREGISSQRASEWMRMAGFTDDLPDVGENAPTLRDLGIDKRPRKSDQTEQANTEGVIGRFDPDDVGNDNADDHGNVEIISRGAAIDIRLGRWEEVLADLQFVDSIIVDPPYGKRTHDQDEYERNDGSETDGMRPNYDFWTPDDVTNFVESWAPRCRGWICAMTSDDLIPAWRAAAEAHDRFAFAPVPCVINGMSVRRWGDGPSSWAVYLMVSRPRHLNKWGTLPGAYVGGRESGAKGGRGKPSWLLDAIVSDYSRPGDLVCDPMAGFGSTLISAIRNGRRAIGAEIDPSARREAIQRFTGKAATP